MTKTMEEVFEALKKKITIVDSQTSQVTTYDCDKCKDQFGWIEKREADVFGNGQLVREEEVWVTCTCVEQRRIERLAKQSQITEKFSEKKFSNFSSDVSDEVKSLARLAKKYFDDFNDIRHNQQNSIALLGQPGIGKTHLLMAVSNLLLAKGKQVMYFPYVSTLKAMQANNFENDARITESACNAEILFIDDLYKPVDRKPQASEWQCSKMYDIINHRYLNNLPILLSSELNFGEMLAVDEAIASRLFEMSKRYTKSINKNAKLNYRMKELFGGAQ